ncbi:MAG: hypothetical protein R3B70_38990 [Polyangiaceae bacterium]
MADDRAPAETAPASAALDALAVSAAPAAPPEQEPVDLLHLDVGAAPPASPLPVSGMVAARIESIDEAARTAVLSVGARSLTASIDPPVDLAVLRTAIARGERVIAQPEAGALVVLGTLRTAATPGVDDIDDLTLRAKRVAIEADHEVRLRSGGASLVLRARGYIESVATDITSRASSLHKIVGRMIRLN